jgi:hypothetical protein
MQMPGNHPLCPSTRVTKKRAELRVGDLNLHVIAQCIRPKQTLIDGDLQIEFRQCICTLVVCFGR